MERAIELSYRGIDPSERIDEVVREGVARLERITDRITGCHIAVERVDSKRQTGSLYRIRLDLRMPGGGVIIDGTPHESSREQELEEALREAFDRAVRRVNRHEGRRRDEVRRERPTPAEVALARRELAAHSGGGPVEIPVENGTLSGELLLPHDAQGLIVFVHGSGSSSLSPRNQHVARILRSTGFGTLLFDLLTPDEEQEDRESPRHGFNIDLLSKRVGEVALWVREQSVARGLPIGLFGASAGAAPALIAAAEHPEGIFAIVSRGGRPDVAREHLPRVEAPTLLIVGGADHPLVEMNRDALGEFATTSELHLVPGATHLFTEKGALDEVADQTAQWFAQRRQPA